MSKKAPKAHGGPNMTPMVDVVMCILIFYMLSATFANPDLFLTNNDQWAESDQIAKNATSYRIGADCGNGTLILYVNGKQIASVQDSSYEKGKVALFALSSTEEDGADVTFDDFIVTDLK